MGYINGLEKYIQSHHHTFHDGDGDSEAESAITQAEITGVVSNLLVTRCQGWMRSALHLKSLDVRMSWLTHLCQIT